MIVQIRPKTTAGFPSTKSAGLMLTSLMRLLAKNCSAVLALLRKCGRFMFLLFSTGKLSPDKISSNVSSFVPSRKSEYKSSMRSGGSCFAKYELIQLTKVFFCTRSCSSIVSQLSVRKN